MAESLPAAAVEKVRYERREDIHQAFLELGSALLICWRYVQRFC